MVRSRGRSYRQLLPRASVSPRRRAQPEPLRVKRPILQAAGAAVQPGQILIYVARAGDYVCMYIWPRRHTWLSLLQVERSHIQIARVAAQAEQVAVGATGIRRHV